MVDKKDRAAIAASAREAQRTLTLSSLSRRLLNRSRYAAELLEKVRECEKHHMAELNDASAILFKTGDEFNGFGAQEIEDKAERIEVLEREVRKVNKIIQRLETALAGAC